MNRDASISLDDTFEELDGDRPVRGGPSPFGDRVAIGRGEFLVKCNKGRGGLMDRYECPEWAYEGSPSCERICVFVPEYVTVPGSPKPILKGWALCCFGCDEEQGEVCTTPSFRPIVYERLMEITGYNYAITQCTDQYQEPSPGLDVSNLPGDRGELDAVATIAGGLVQRGFLRVPSVDDPSHCLGLNLSLGGYPLYLSLPGYGWRVTVAPNYLPLCDDPFASPASVTPFPSVTPTASMDRNDKARPASVILPEIDGPQQYWVVVPESSRHPQPPFRYSQLITPRWTVTFYRLPISGGRGRSGCGCT